MNQFQIQTLIIKPQGRRFETIGVSKGVKLQLDGDIFPNINRGFNGKHFTIGINLWYPFAMRKRIRNETIYEGYCVDLATELSGRLNFTFTIVEPADGQWGTLKPDGNYTGVVGMLQHFQVDVSVAPLTITPEREFVMDGTFPYYYDKVVVLYKRPDPKYGMWKTYFHPFKTEVFLCLMGSLVIGALIYIILSVVTFTTSENHCEPSLRELVLSKAAEGAVYLMASLIQYSHDAVPQFCSGRFFVSFWWLFTMIVAAIYKGNLIAFLLVPLDDVPFTNVAELADQDVYRWGVTGSTVVEYLFKVSQRPDFQMIGEGLEQFKLTDPETNSLDPLVHLRKVEAGRYAYFSDMVPAEIWMIQNCDLRILKETVIPLPFVVGLHDNSAYTTVFNEQLLEMDQTGLYKAWRDRWWPKGSTCSVEEQHGTKMLSILETQSAFYVLCLGLLLAIVFLVLECCWKLACCISVRKRIAKLRRI